MSLQRFPSLPPEIKNHCSIWADSEENLAAIPKSGLEIKNHCSPRAVLEGFLAAIPKSGPEIKNHCSIWADSGEILASIPKSGPEIKNHCSRGLVESAGGPFSFAATKNRIGHGHRCHYDRSRRNHPPSQQRRLESDAEDRCHYDRSRLNHSPSQQRRLESDTDIAAATVAAGETILLCGNEGLKRNIILHRHIFQ